MDESESKPSIQPTDYSKAPQNATQGKRTEAKKDTAIIPDIPPSPRGKKNTEHCRPDQTPWWKWCIEVSAVLVGIFVAIVYSRQLGQMIEGNRISRESLETVQRSYVLFKGNTFDTSSNVKQELIEFTARWENSGTTSANASGFMYNIADIPFEPTDQQFKMGVVQNEEPQWVTRTIGPHDPFTIGPFVVPHERILDSPGKRIYFFGWMIYRDVFENSPTHVTKFCRFPKRVSFLEPPPTHKIKIDFGYCKEHNCADEHCKDYKEITSIPK